MVNDEKLFKFNGKFIFIGFGSVGQGFLPLLFRHVEISPRQVRVLQQMRKERLKLRTSIFHSKLNHSIQRIIVRYSIHY
ncbi:MAG: saccharopine dehydrogenase NADP-binding domain-containing protein [Nitrosomonas sp.]|nr:saccharopine dehydrogenase NADP-binding domain-containing protein [Nitrosomonas sp.]